MTLFEKVKSLVCSPCTALCDKLNNLLKSDSGKKEHLKEHAIRRNTGWIPANMKMSEDDDDDDDEDDDEPLTNIKQKKGATVYPLAITSTGQNIFTKADDPVTVNWTNKNPEIYSVVNTSEAKSLPYWVESNLQYVIVLPADNHQRTPSQLPRPPLAPSQLPQPQPQTPSLSEEEEEEEPPAQKDSPDVEEQPESPKRVTYFAEPKPVKNEEEDDENDSDSEESFEPRSSAKPPKSKGACCVKKQNSG